MFLPVFIHSPNSVDFKTGLAPRFLPLNLRLCTNASCANELQYRINRVV